MHICLVQFIKYIKISSTFLLLRMKKDNIEDSFHSNS